MAVLRTGRFDPLVTTLTDLQTWLAGGQIRSTDIVNVYLEQIKTHNHDELKLNAIISTPPKEDLLKRAKELDDARAQGIVRSPVHGIPIIIKVCAQAVRAMPVNII